MPARAAHEPIVERLRLRQAPLAAAAVWFALGIGLARRQTLEDRAEPVAYVLGALVVLAGIALAGLRARARTAWVPVAGVWVVLGLASAQWHPAPPAPVALLAYADNLSRTVRGHVVRVRVPPPVPAAAASDADQVPPWEAAEDTSAVHGEPALSIDLAVDAVEDVTPDASTMVPATGGVRLSVFGAATGFGQVPGRALDCGDELELPLRLRLPDRFRDPGAFEYAGLLAGQGIAARSSVAAKAIQVTGAQPPGFACRLFAAQAWASARLLAFTASPENLRLPAALRLGQADALMLNAMLFGDRAGLSHTLRVGFERTGSFHLFVVSGLHVALLAGGIFWLLRRLRAPEWLATLLTLGAAAAYAALTGFGQPAQRALGMLTVFLLARLLAREHDRMPLNALGAAALAMLVWAPGSLFDASFQMTVLAIVAIAGIAIPLGEQSLLRYARVTREVFARHRSNLAPRAAQLRLMLELWGETLAGVLGRRSRRAPAVLLRTLLWGLELALIAAVAELVMVLPMATYFHRAAVFALPANMVVIPVIALLAPAAVATFVCSLVSPWLALAPGSVTALLLHGIAGAIHRVSHLQAADVRVPGPVWWVAGLAVAAWFACCWLVRRGRWGAFATALALPVIAACVLWPESAATRPGALEITAIDVGQGDSLLAVGPQGETMLIDAGGPVGSHGAAEIVSSFDVGEEVVSPYLWSRRLRRVDVVVLTHAHTDHMGGMPAVLRNFRPRELWVGVDPASPLYAALLAEASHLGIHVRHLQAGERVRWGTVEVAVLAPAAGYANRGSPRNDDSLVLRMQYGRASVLLEGDAERPSEDAMLAAGLVTPATLLKVGHHGSKTSTNPEFLAAVRPQEAVISVGRNNTFGHPRAEVIQRLASGGAHVFRTDEFGLTTFLLTSDGRVSEVIGATQLETRNPQPAGVEASTKLQSATKSAP